MLMQGAMDGGWFAFWVETQLAPTLREGDIVVCDNLSVHKTARARAAIEARGAELRFLLAYSPDLNPIEMMFAKIKALVRSAASRRFESLANASEPGAALEAVTPDECAAYLRHAGYHSN
jgi:transposase